MKLIHARQYFKAKEQNTYNIVKEQKHGKIVM